MLFKLEDVLKSKERELKLYKKFLDLKEFLNSDIFPTSDLPLAKHTEDLKEVIESIIPDPRDRTQEMFSGEIFVLLGTIYLHDIMCAKNTNMLKESDIYDGLDGPGKNIFFNHAIGRKLNIPPTAIEMINYLSFSNLTKKMPIEWEIAEDGKKAIIRNSRVIESLFNFSHALTDIFKTDIGHMDIRRFQNPKLVLRVEDARIDINSREGIITITYRAKFPYEMHVLENVKIFIEKMFTDFKNAVNGRLGFDYRHLIWDITSDFNYDRNVCGVPKFSPYREFETPPFDRWEEASLMLDKLFDTGCVIVVGEACMGKTTILRSFVFPQLFSISGNAFYSEVWKRPVNEMRDVVYKRIHDVAYCDVDIISTTKRFSKDSPCFFIIDCVERVAGMEEGEKEKFVRFIDFCIDHKNVYLIVCGEKETFFEWYAYFRKAGLSSIYEIKALDDSRVIDAYGDEAISLGAGVRYKPIEFELIHANLDLKKIVDDIMKGIQNEMDFREILSSIVDTNERFIKYHTLADIHFNTCIPKDRILPYVEHMKKKDIVKETNFSGVTHYSLTSRYLNEPLYRLLGLSEFEQKKQIRSLLQNGLVNEVFLDEPALDMIRKWMKWMVFSKREMGLILGSLIMKKKDTGPFFEKANEDGTGIDIQQILKLLYIDDPEIKGAAIRLLIDIQDKDAVNPLLLYLKREDDNELKDLVIKGMGQTKKKGTLLAIMETLRDTGDSQLRMKTVEYFVDLLGVNAKSLLVAIKEREDDPNVLERVDGLLNAIEERA